MRILCCLAALGMASSLPVHAATWPGWRGPSSQGVAPEGTYPIRWTESENVAWKAALPGAAGSTPAVTADRIFVTSPKEGQNALLCFSRGGELLWETTIGAERPGKHKKGSGANPSPTTDGQRVYVYFKSGDLAAVDFQGNIVWRTNLQQRFGPDDLWWDLGTSPVLTSRHLVVAVMQTENSYLAAFDPVSGDLAWKVDRNLGAPEEAAQSYSTPVVVEHNGQEQIVVLGADHCTCHAAEDGRELWRVGGLNPTQNHYFRSIAGPVVCDGVVIAPYARGETVTGIRLGGSGDVSRSHVLWHLNDAGADVPTPAAANGRFYVLRDKAGEVVCRDVDTAEVVWSRSLPRNRNSYSASPILAGGRLYCTREDGVTFVLNAATGEIEAENPLGDEFTVASPVCLDGQILLRTFEHLYCIGQ